MLKGVGIDQERDDRYDQPGPVTGSLLLLQLGSLLALRWLRRLLLLRDLSLRVSFLLTRMEQVGKQYARAGGHNQIISRVQAAP